MRCLLENRKRWVVIMRANTQVGHFPLSVNYVMESRQLARDITRCFLEKLFSFQGNPQSSRFRLVF